MTEESQGPPTTSERLGNATELPHERSRAAAERTGGPTGPGRAFPPAIVAMIAAFVVIAVVAGVAAGAQYAIPVVVLLAIVLAFLGFHRAVGSAKTERHGDATGDAAASDAEDPVPHMGFDDQSSLGDSSEQPDQQYTQPPSTGAR